MIPIRAAVDANNESSKESFGSVFQIFHSDNSLSSSVISSALLVITVTTELNGYRWASLMVAAGVLQLTHSIPALAWKNPIWSLQEAQVYVVTLGSPIQN